nr:FecR family protein [Pseudoflavitalea sp. G-6-1-2]
MSGFKKWGWAAAAVVLLTGGALFLFNNPTKVQQPATPQTVVQRTIQPGKNGALLTLADGSQIVLDSVGDGVIASQQGSNAVLKNGALSYSGNESGEPAYNTLSTPRGRQFRLQLPDGSRVWLNAASSIRYPTAFAGNERKVEVSGEAYFEVAPNINMPFRVNVNNRANIEVLGTSFNVSSYENEANISTTLIEGAVKVSVDAGSRSAILKPGQQASIQQGTNNLAVVNDVDTDKIIAWKNGYFNFGKATLPEVMRQLERWYDIETVYEKGIPETKFVGKLTRNITLNELFQILDSTGVNFRIEGRKLIVTK